MSLGRKGHGALIGLLVGIIFAATAATHDQARGHRTESSQPPGLESLRLPGQTVTILPDGRWLLLGGEVNGRAVATGTLWDPNSQTATQLPGALHSGRAWHTATVLPDGTVLIIGGRDGQGAVLDRLERFVPGTGVFELLPMRAHQPRIGHTATLLTDGTILIAGGRGADGTILATAEQWTGSTDQRRIASALRVPRHGHTATLLRDGGVLITGGLAADGSRLTGDEMFDPASGIFRPAPVVAIGSGFGTPELVASIPADGAVDAPIDVQIALRFSRPLAPATVSPDTVNLTGPDGLEAVTVVAAEAGRLAFVRPIEALTPGGRYSLSIHGARDTTGQLIQPTTIEFVTVGSATGDATASTASPTPTDQTIDRARRSRRPTAARARRATMKIGFPVRASIGPRGGPDVPTLHGRSSSRCGLRQASRRWPDRC